MSTPSASLVEEIEVEGVSLKTVGRTAPYEGQVMQHKTGKTGNAIGNGKFYVVKVVDGVIEQILIDYSKLEDEDRKNAEKQRMEQVAGYLEGATTLNVTWVDDFHDHTTSLSTEERTALALSFLGKASELIESSKTVGEFALLVTDPDGKKGSGQSVWRLCGRISGRIPARGIVNVRLWHYGPGSRH